MTPDQSLGVRIWPTILIPCAIAAVPFISAGFRFSSITLVGAPVIGAICCRILMRYREVYKFGAAAEAVLQMAFVSLFGVMTSYVAATANAPLIDDILLRADQAIGYDWQTYLRVLGANKGVRLILYISYLSIFYQPAVLACVLVYTGNVQKFEILVLSMMVGLTVTAVIFTICPATTAWSYLGQEALASSAFPGVPVSGENWMVALPEIRAGGGRLISEPLGLIAFPSFHCAVALLNIRAAWSSRWLRIPFLILNVLMIISTPACGGHYMVDVIAGAVLAAIAAVIAGKLHRLVGSIRLAGAGLSDAAPASFRAEK